MTFAGRSLRARTIASNSRPRRVVAVCFGARADITDRQTDRCSVPVSVYDSVQVSVSSYVSLCLSLVLFLSLCRAPLALTVWDKNIIKKIH